MDEKNINVSERRREFPILQILLKNIWIIIICTVVVFGGMFAYQYKNVTITHTVKQRVCLKLSLATDRGEELDKKNDITLSKMYLPVIISTIKTDVVARRATEIYQENCALEGKTPIGTVNDANIAAFNNDSSLIFQIGYSGATAEECKDKLIAVMQAANEDLKNDPALSASKIELVPTQRDYIDTPSSGLVGSGIRYAIIGMLLGVAIAVVRYFLDNKVKDAKELEEITGVTLLAYLEKQ